MESLTHSFSFEALPEEAFATVLSHLSLQDLVNMQLVTRRGDLVRHSGRGKQLRLIQALAANKKGWSRGAPCLAIVNVLAGIVDRLNDLPLLVKVIKSVGLESHSSSAISFQVQKSVTMTARSLLLNKEVGVPVFGPTAMDGNDVYTERLHLTHELLANWSSRGLRILDLGCGMSLFPAEAATLYGLQVDGIDLSPTSEHKHQVSISYLCNIARLYLTLLSNGSDATTIERERTPMARLLFERCVATIGAYQAFAVTQGDATNLEHVPDDTYDVVLSLWLFMYLPRGAQQAAFAEVVRVTKPGGIVRIFSGNTLAIRNKFTEKRVEEWARFKRKGAPAKKAVILKFKHDWYLEFQVVADDDKCVIS
jgi:SAM-dependent methyltransferase